MQYYNPHFLIATLFGIGKIPFMPGTIGSIVAFPLSYYCIKMLEAIRYDYFSNQNALIFSLVGLLIITVALFIIGAISSHQYSKATANSDPKEVVIDEVVGQMLTLIFTIPLTVITIKSYTIATIAIGSLVANFVLFRIFDIFKPWPINWVDKHVKGGLGIMLDDVLAAVFSIVVYSAILFKFFG